MARSRARRPGRLPAGDRRPLLWKHPPLRIDSAQTLNALLLLGVALILLIGLAIWAAVSHSTNPVLAAAAMVAAGVIGSIVAPGGPGSTQTSSGIGSAGTRQNPTAFWSGSVNCQWQKGQDSTVQDVFGFWVLVSDPAVARALGVGTGSTVAAIKLPPSGGDQANFGIRQDPNSIVGAGSMLALEGLSGNATSGRAVASGAAIVFAWSCSQGP